MDVITTGRLYSAVVDQVLGDGAGVVLTDFQPEVSRLNLEIVALEPDQWSELTKECPNLAGVRLLLRFDHFDEDEVPVPASVAVWHS